MSHSRVYILNMRIALFDTETTGKLSINPYVVQFAIRVIDISYDPYLVVQEMMTLVKSPVNVPQTAVAIHGVDQAMSMEGIHPKALCKWYEGIVTKCDMLVAHNAEFDTEVMDLQCRRFLKKEIDLPKVCCTMQETIDLCKIKTEDGEFKWPKLEEALDILCGVKLEGAHDALADTRGCNILFDYLVKQGKININ
jgi:DNA polymerase-3 subunit epsilon